MSLIALGVLGGLGALRFVIQKLRTGDSGLRVGVSSGLGFAVEMWLLLHLAIGAFGCFLDTFPIYADGAFAPLGTRLVDVPDAVRVIGFVVAVACSVAVLASQLNMGKSWRVGQDVGEKTSLVTGGVYAFIRNPIYSFIMLTGIAIAAIAPNALLVEVVVGTIVGVEVLVRLIEEPHMLRTHSDEYRKWASRVGRFVPGIGRLPPL